MARDSHEKDVAALCSPDNKYVRRELIGKGSFKTIYKAYDEESGLEVAWNEVRVSKNDRMRRERIKLEIQLLSQLNHPNIISIHDAWEDDAGSCIVFITELMTSGTLRKFILDQRGGVVRRKIIQNFCIQILEGLIYLHSKNVIHRDLKCDNIFLNGNKGEVKIGDFGLSIAKVKTYAESVIGTPEFMAPELYEEKYNEKVDIYSFGMCVLEMATGEYPYLECENVGQVFRKVTSGIKPQAIEKIRDADVREFVTACLNPVAQRPSGKDLLHFPFFKEVLASRENHHPLPAISLIAGQQLLQQRRLDELRTVNSEPCLDRETSPLSRIESAPVIATNPIPAYCSLPMPIPVSPPLAPSFATPPTLGPRQAAPPLTLTPQHDAVSSPRTPEPSKPEVTSSPASAPPEVSQASPQLTGIPSIQSDELAAFPTEVKLENVSAPPIIPKPPTPPPYTVDQLSMMMSPPREGIAQPPSLISPTSTPNNNSPGKDLPAPAMSPPTPATGSVAPPRASRPSQLRHPLLVDEGVQQTSPPTTVSPPAAQRQSPPPMARTPLGLSSTVRVARVLSPSTPGDPRMGLDQMLGSSGSLNSSQTIRTPAGEAIPSTSLSRRPSNLGLPVDSKMSKLELLQQQEAERAISLAQQQAETEAELEQQKREQTTAKIDQGLREKMLEKVLTLKRQDQREQAEYEKEKASLMQRLEDIQRERKRLAAIASGEKTSTTPLALSPPVCSRSPILAVQPEEPSKCSPISPQLSKVHSSHQMSSTKPSTAAPSFSPTTTAHSKLLPQLPNLSPPSGSSTSSGNRGSHWITSSQMPPPDPLSFDCHFSSISNENYSSSSSSSPIGSAQLPSAAQPPKHPSVTNTLPAHRSASSPQLAHCQSQSFQLLHPVPFKAATNASGEGFCQHPSTLTGPRGPCVQIGPTLPPPASSLRSERRSSNASTASSESMTLNPGDLLEAFVKEGRASGYSSGASSIPAVSPLGPGGGACQCGRASYKTVLLSSGASNQIERTSTASSVCMVPFCNAT